MILLGNYKEWIQPEWVTYMLETPGLACPRDKIVENQHELSDRASKNNTGYDPSQVYWHAFMKEHLPFNITTPIETKNCIWWFIKMMPGQFMPMHMDNDPNTTVRRYWMPVIDYEQGHALIYGDMLLTNYKAGDLYKFDNPNMLHGSCNIGFSPRLSFNMDVYE
jgi:hypothetical protein